MNNERTKKNKDNSFNEKAKLWIIGRKDWRN